MIGAEFYDRAHPLSKQFYDLLETMAELHARKQADYGRPTDPFSNVRASEEFGVDAWIGAMMRGNDKVRRVQSFILNGSLKNESVEDSLLDLAVYSLISLVLYKEKYGESVGDATGVSSDESLSLHPVG